MFLPLKYTCDIDNNLSFSDSVTQISDITLTPEEVALCLYNLDISEASSPDGISARILKECTHQIAPSICDLFNHSLYTGCLPFHWKSADVAPIHKKNIKSPLKITDRSSSYLSSVKFWNVVSPGDSTITSSTSLHHPNKVFTQLIQVLHSVGQCLDKNIQSHIIYLELAKAFDSVDHQILLRKLKSYGVTGRLLDWFCDYLSSRTQRVVVEGVPSSWVPVISGVPQGSILGPILFAVFINDLPEAVSGGSSEDMYADDTKLYENINSTTDSESLQQSLSKLNTWSNDNNIRFNAEKCKVLSVTRKKNPVNYNYHLDPSSLLRVGKEKDLGVIVTNNLVWNTHIDMITAKANKMLGLLKRTCPLLTRTKFRRSLYLSLVKSKLRYGSEIWSSSNVSLKIKIEVIQRRATRWVL